VSEGAAVLLVDWENLAGAITTRGKRVEAAMVDDLYAFALEHSHNSINAHMAAAKFDAKIYNAMKSHLIVPEVVGSTKEQADIQLTVLAMDYLHNGCQQFILVTGDQDFIPLLHRLHSAGRKVTLIYGDPNRLSGVLGDVLKTPGLDSRDIAQITKLRSPEVSTALRDVVGLLDLQRRGTFLGGPEKGMRASLLQQWGVISDAEESSYWGLVNDLCLKIVRRDTAALQGGKWLPKNATRTVLNVTANRYLQISRVDYVLRLLAARAVGLTLGSLRSGPFQTGDGSELTEAVDALRAVGLIRKGADGAYAVTSPDLEMGYLEPLWRVHAAVQAECYKRGRRSVPFNYLETTLTRQGIGPGRDQRASGKVKSAIAYAKAVGSIDSAAWEERRHVVSTDSPMIRPFEETYIEFYKTFRARIGHTLEEREVLAELSERDAPREDPIFGYGSRDQQRFMRVLRQTGLILKRGDHLTVLQSNWGDASSAVSGSSSGT
jgi:hypothetical protein